ncbi:hypothetical protein NDU88_002909 [Pleurodeles waltl]|uniref:Uncharacterized protein n=1 Tax=Pleurodeles waltl TaxID=8319 RepID=A0AAV7MPD4_PLEWA|nr:hypothetical protein NDU88_002909 [Pleurodeles waltl]
MREVRTVLIFVVFEPYSTGSCRCCSPAGISEVCSADSRGLGGRRQTWLQRPQGYSKLRSVHRELVMRDPVTDSVGDGAPPSLHLINQTMMVQHKQIQGDNKKAKVASKHLQVAVSKIAKTCSEIGERITTIETRTSVLEAEFGMVVQQSTMHELQLNDIQWRLEDFENRQRCSNLRGFKKDRKAKTRGLL